MTHVCHACQRPLDVGMGLTEQQNALWRYVADYARNGDGKAPTYNEMKVALGLRSTSGVARIVTSLEERGYIRRRHGQWRALELLRWPWPMGRRPVATAEPRIVTVTRYEIAR